MVKKALLGFVVSILALVIVLLGIVSSPSVISGLVNQYFLDSDTKLTCLDYQLTSFSHLNIHRACVELNQLTLVATVVRYAPFKKTLAAERVEVTVKQTEHNPPADLTASNTAFVLPDNLPDISIDNLVLYSEILNTPVHLSVQQTQKHRFDIISSGDVSPALIERGSIEFSGNEITAQIHWSPSVAFDMIHFDQQLKDTLAFDQALIISQLTLSSEMLASSHKLGPVLKLSHADCTVALATNGTVDFNYFLNKSEGEIAPSQTLIHADFSPCNPITQRLGKVKNKQLNLTFNGVVSIEDKTLSLPSLTLRSVAKDFLTAQFTDIETTGPNEISFNALVTAKMPEVGLFNTDLSLHKQGPAIQVSGLISSAKVLLADNQLENAEAHYSFNLVIEDTPRGEGQVKFNADKLIATHMGLANITSELDILLAPNTQISGQTQIGLLDAKVIDTSVSLEHQFNVVVAERTISGQHVVNLPSELSFAVLHQLSEDQHNAQIQLPLQPVSNLNQIVGPLGVQTQEGNLLADIKLDLLSLSGNGKIEVQDTAVKYGEYLAQGINYSPDFRLDSGNLQLSPSMFRVENLDAGVEITDITGELSSENGRFQVNRVRSELLGGLLEIDSAWLDNKDQTVTLKLRDIDLQSVMQTQQQAGIDSSGIELSGKLNGDVPVKVESGQASIALASLINSTEGTLKITGNSGFEALKVQQPEIGQQLALLEHVEFETLTSDLTMDTDGMVFFDMKIRGVNPEHKQPINFNYTHEQNIFTLLKALRLSEQIEQSIQQKMTGDQ